MKKRIIALLVMLVMVVGLLPMSAMATDPAVVVTVTADDNKTAVLTGETVTFSVKLKSTIGLTSFKMYLNVPEEFDYVSGSLTEGLNTILGVGAADVAWTPETSILDASSGVALEGLSGDGQVLMTFTLRAKTVCDTCEVNMAMTKGSGKGAFYDETPAKVDAADYALNGATIAVAKNPDDVTPDTLTLTCDTNDLKITNKDSKPSTAAPVVGGVDTEGGAYSDLIKSRVRYSIPTTAGVSINAETGVVSITDPVAVTATSVTVTATLTNNSKTVTATGTVNIDKDAAAATTVEVSGPATAIIPAADTDPANNYEYTATVKDQYGVTMTGQTITWATNPASVTGVSIDTDGKLSVGPTATAGAIKVKATVGSVDGEADVNVTKIAFTLGTDAVKAVDGTYGDTYGDLVTIDASKITAKVGTTTVTGTYSILEGEDNYPDAAATVAYTVVFNNDTYKNIEVAAGTVKVDPAPLKIEAQDVGVRVGTADADMPADSEYYTVTGLVAGDDEADVVTVTVTKPTISTAEAGKEYTITVAYTAGTKAANYTITGAASQTCTLSITKKKVLAPLPSQPAGPSDPGTTTPTTPGSAKFVDVAENDWFYEAVNFVADKGLMTGTSDDTFSPNMNTSRAMIATILWRHAGSPEPKARIADFPDVEDGWYLKAVRWCAENEIVTGFEDGSFRPNDNITREQMVVMMKRYAEKSGLDVSATADLADFADGASVGEWAAPAVQWAVGAKLIQGKGANDLDPQGLATRAEVATILQRFVNLK